MNTLEKLKSEIDEMDKLMVKYSDFGASDTEPDAQFQFLLVRFFKGEDVTPTREDWELYSSMKGWEKIADKLNEKVLAICEVMNTMPRNMNEALEKMLREYTWRIDW